MRNDVSSMPRAMISISSATQSGTDVKYFGFSMHGSRSSAASASQTIQYQYTE